MARVKQTHQEAVERWVWSFHFSWLLGPWWPAFLFSSSGCLWHLLPRFWEAQETGELTLELAGMFPEQPSRVLTRHGWEREGGESRQLRTRGLLFLQGRKGMSMVVKMRKRQTQLSSFIPAHLQALETDPWLGDVTNIIDESFKNTASSPPVHLSAQS
jgi:hypothetical protein